MSSLSKQVIQSNPIAITPVCIVVLKAEIDYNKEEAKAIKVAYPPLNLRLLGADETERQGSLAIISKIALSLYNDALALYRKTIEEMDESGQLGLFND